MKSVLKTMALALAFLSVTGCEMTGSSTTSNELGQESVDSLKFFKHKETGLCFATTLMGRMSTSGSYTENVLLTEVPCDKVQTVKK